MKNYTNLYTQKLFTELHPLVGTIVAQSVLKRLAEKIGKTEETLSIKDSAEIVNGLEKGLSVFLGSEAAGEAARRIGQLK
jgi:hypothetical protein